MNTTNIVEPTLDDVTLAQAVQVTGRCAKTLRRAVQDGQLSRRYALSARGPQLVFARDELQTWLQGRRSPGRRRSTASAPEYSVAMMASIAQIQQALDYNRAGLDRLANALGRHHALLTDLSRQLSAFLQENDLCRPSEVPDQG